MQYQSQSNYASGTSHPAAQNLSPEGLRMLEGVAQRHGVSLDAVVTLLDAVSRGGGSQAQFSHQELGGMGQWQLGGMIMVGDMFNHNLKYRVDSLLTELSNLWRNQPLYLPPEPGQSAGGFGNWWPAEFGSPSSSGAQNDMRYAYFPNARRLVVQKNGANRIYDTGNHQISGVSQQQSGNQTLTFSSQFGQVSTLDLPEVFLGNAPAPVPAPYIPQRETAPFYSAAPQNLPTGGYSPAPPCNSSPNTSLPTDDIVKMIERLAELNQKGILSNAEFGTKKAELLSRL